MNVDIEMVDSLETVLSELVGDVVTPIGVSHLSEHIAERLAAAGWHLARPGSLDAAWAEAEAAMPEGWKLAELSRVKPDWDGAIESLRDEWWAMAFHPGKTLEDESVEDGRALTPAGALRVLAAKLREMV